MSGARCVSTARRIICSTSATKMAGGAWYRAAGPLQILIDETTPHSGNVVGDGCVRAAGAERVYVSEHHRVAARARLAETRRRFHVPPLSPCPSTAKIGIIYQTRRGASLFCVGPKMQRAVATPLPGKLEASVSVMSKSSRDRWPGVHPDSRHWPRHGGNSQRRWSLRSARGWTPFARNHRSGQTIGITDCRARSGCSAT